MTKGDNNDADDTNPYAAAQCFLNHGDVDGTVVGYVPYVGYVTILLNDYPWLKTVMIAFVGLAALLQRD